MAATRSQTQEDTAPTCHTENFFYDKDDNSALTVLVHNVRFHIMINVDKLESDAIKGQYLEMLNAVRVSDGEEQGNVDNTKKRKRKLEDDGAYEEAGQTDSGYGSSPPVPEDSKDSKDSGVQLAENDNEEEASSELHDWIIAPFGDIFAQEAPASEEKTTLTLHDWYHRPAHFYSLIANTDDELLPIKESAIPELEQRITNLIPSLPLPKYITNYNIPSYKTTDLEILETSSSPSPLHPSIVRSTTTNETYFLKLVDMTQPGPTKRELKMMKDMEARGLHTKIRVPQVLGLVSLPSSPKSTIVGFLQTHIPSPTPLTHMLDTDVAEDKRQTWAADSARMIKVLHDNGFVWGDAKADNFMVDDKARLWIIDFGGSYTEGWIDPELNETEEGDEMGLRKIVNALEDPENGTFDPEEEQQGKDEESARLVENPQREAKRKRVRYQDEDEDEDEDEAEEQQEVQAEEETYCYCGGPSEGQMIGCDNEQCPMAWFHISCTNLDEIPPEGGMFDLYPSPSSCTDMTSEQWLCNDCQEAS